MQDGDAVDDDDDDDQLVMQNADAGSKAPNVSAPALIPPSVLLPTQIARPCKSQSAQSNRAGSTNRSTAA